MMKKIYLGTLLMALIISLFANNLFAQGEKSSLSISLKSHFDKWTVSLNKVTESIYDLWGLSQKKHTIEEKESDIGLLIGPEVVFSYRKIFTRGFYLQGRHNFSGSEKSDRKYFGIEIGVGKKDKGCFIGWRKMDFSFPNWQSKNITDHNIATPVWGFKLNSDKPGLFAGFGIATNLFLFQIGNTLDDVFIFDGELNVGYRFKEAPLILSAGYRYWWFGKAINTYYIYEPPFYVGEKTATVQFEDVGYGPIFEVRYSF
jgi:hypothetical protein